MEVAEEELARAGQPKGMFLALRPPDEMVGLQPEVYRSHCRELLLRNKAGKSLEEPTDAEVLLTLSEASLRAPFNNVGMAAFAAVAARVFVDKEGQPTLPADVRLDAREPWEGAIEELLAGLRPRLRVPGRRAKPVRETTLEAFA